MDKESGRERESASSATPVLSLRIEMTDLDAIFHFRMRNFDERLYIISLKLAFHRSYTSN